MTRHKLLHFRQPILRVIRVLREVPGREQGLASQIPVVVVLVHVTGIDRELVPGIDHRPARGPVPHRIVGEGLGGPEQWMTGGDQAIEIIVAEALRAAPVGQTRPIPDGAVGVGGLIDLRTRGRELVEDLGDLRSGIITVRRPRAVGQGHGRPPREGVVGEDSWWDTGLAASILICR